MQVGVSIETWLLPDSATHLKESLLHMKGRTQLLSRVLLDHDRVEFLRVIAALLVHQTRACLHFGKLYLGGCPGLIKGRQLLLNRLESIGLRE